MMRRENGGLETLGDVAAVVGGRISHCERRETLSRREKHFIDLINCPRRGTQKKNGGGGAKGPAGAGGTANPQNWHSKDGGGHLMSAAQKTILLALSLTRFNTNNIKLTIESCSEYPARYKLDLSNNDANLTRTFFLCMKKKEKKVINACSLLIVSS